MKSFLRAALLGACLCGLSGLAVADSAPDPQHPPAEAFGALPVISSPALSPDGHHLAIIQSIQGRPAIVIYELPQQPGKMPTVVAIDQWIMTRIRWAKNDRLVVTVKDGRHVYGMLLTWERALSVGVNGKDDQILMQNIDALGGDPEGALINDIALDDPDHIYMSLFDDGRVDLMQVDVHSGNAVMAVKGYSNTEQWLTDGHGQVVARIDNVSKDMLDCLYLYHDGTDQQVASFPASGDQGLELLGLTEDGNGLVSMGSENNAEDMLLRRDLTSDKVTTLFSTPGYDVAGAINDGWTGRVIGASYADDKMEYHYFDPSHEALQHSLEAAFPGASVVAVSSDLLGDKVIAAVDTASAPPGYYLVDRITGATTSLGHTYPGLKGVVLGEMKPYPYKARDGLAIPAYLTLPPGKPAKNMPLVVMPHGGPDARDMLGFDWWAQFLVNRGYAVLQPEYRGSSGYGRKFTEAGLKQWGLKMQDDITDGVKKTIADGIVDPHRVCIVGASYGGYAALAGGAFTPNLYACVVSFAGVSDLPDMLHSERMYDGKQAVSFWASRIGTTDENWTQLKATSPARHADQFRAPVLLMHGEGDTTVRIDQSETMKDALKKADKDVTFIRFDGEDHYMNLAATRVRVLEETEKFLDKYIGH